MDTTRFDRVSRLFAERRLSRRAALAQGGAGIAAAGLAAAGVRAAAAQDATPDGTPGAAPAAEGDKTAFLFVQTFGAGSLAPKEDEDGTLTLTADHLAGQTVYFSDRPERIVGMVPTERFLGTMPARTRQHRGQDWALPRPTRRTPTWSSPAPRGTKGQATSSWSS